MHEDFIKDHLKRLEPFKIEFLDEKNRLYRLSSQIECVTNDYIIISPPTFEEASYDLPVNSEVSIVFYRREGMLYAQTRILGKQGGIDSKMKISKPYNFNLVNRRAAKRFRFNFKLDIEYYINKFSFDKKILNESTHDISISGISYISDEPFGKFDKIKCFIYLDATHSFPIIANCRYVYTRKIQAKTGFLYHNAFEYTRISQEDLLRLQKRLYR